jgi:hypothetical protein
MTIYTMLLPWCQAERVLDSAVRKCLWFQFSSCAMEVTEAVETVEVMGGGEDH